MPRLVPSLVFVLAVMVAGGATARLVDQEGFGPRPAAGQQAQVQQAQVQQAQVQQAQVQQAQVQQQPSPARDTLEKGKDSGMERVRANVPLPPELKALRDEIKEQVGDLRATVNKKYEEAGAKAAAYVLWAAVGLFVIMVLASVLGGVIVALIFRRNRNA